MMRLFRLIYMTLPVACLMLFTTSCESKWPNNGDLDDMWQLMSVEQDGTVSSLKETKHYWSVRSNLVQFSSYDNTDGNKFCHFERKDGRLILTDFCHESMNATAEDNDEWITYEERSLLEQWGIYAEPDTEHPERLTQTFTIDYLDSDRMILSADTYKLEFRKF